MREKNLFQSAIIGATIFVLLLIGVSAFSQSHTIQTRNESGSVTISFESAGVDAMRITFGDKAKVIKVRHLDKAGDLQDRVASICATAEDGAMPLRHFLRIQTCESCNYHRSVSALSKYHRKAQKVYKELCEIMEPAILLEVSHTVLVQQE